MPRPAAAQPECAGDDAGVLVVQVSGRLDPVLVDYAQDQIGEAERACALAVVLQLNSSGAVGNEDGAADLADTVGAATIPVAVWVGPSGSRAAGAAVDLVAAADQTAVAAPGGSIEVTRRLLAARDVAPDRPR